MFSDKKASKKAFIYKLFIHYIGLVIEINNNNKMQHDFIEIINNTHIQTCTLQSMLPTLFSLGKLSTFELRRIRTI